MDGRTARPSGSKAGAREPRSAAKGLYVGASPFWVTFGAFAKKVTRRKGERGPQTHHKIRISPKSKKPQHQRHQGLSLTNQISYQEGTTTACPLIARSTNSRLATAYIA